MDRVELGRQTATTLHLKAVANGLDPWKPYEFAVAEARRRGLDVEPTAVGSALLNGGRAAFIPRDRLILHENAGSSFEQAFLIAHELGHVELGDDIEAEPANTIDPARPAEPSPIGAERVVDYGRRQRREVQMDLFAREFLLPRPVARKLHLEDNLQVTDIAERLGAPLDVVAQQLFDALLLPSISPGAMTSGVEHPLNSLQASAADHRGIAYLLEAGPGTGKTQTLTGRVERLLTEGIDPRTILLLTFSNKAAHEMAYRIAQKHKDSAAAMWIGTFHSFGLDLIHRFHAELGLPKEPRMIDRVEAVELLEREFPRLDLRHYRNLYDPTQIISDALAAISRAKDEVVDETRYLQLAEAMLFNARDDETIRAAEKAIEVARIYAAYETLKRQEHRIDFGDLVAMPARLLEGSPAIRTHLQEQYKHILVDEYQDVNRSSVRLLSALCGTGENLWCVGDAKQSIYRFRGASSFNMARFGTEDFTGGIRGRLKKNYRSTEEIVNAFSTFAVGMKTGGAVARLEADRGVSGNRLELRTVERSELQLAALADGIEEMRRAGHAYHNQAVLCTGNEMLSSMAQGLERLGVPVLFLGSLFERPEIKDLLSLLSLLTDPWAMGLTRVACWPEFSLSITDVAAVFDHLRDAKKEPGAWLRSLGAIPELSQVGRRSLEGLARTLCDFDQTSSPWTVLAHVLLSRTRIAARIADSSSISDRTRGIAIWQLMNFLRVQPPGPGLPIVRLLDRVRRLVRLGDDRDLRQLPAAAQGLDAVRLMTIHGAKGLEFPVIHVPSLNQGTMPRKPPSPPCPPPTGMVEGAQGNTDDSFDNSQAEEQECLFYVALSRARDRLVLYAPTKKSNGYTWTLSSFLGRLGGVLSQRQVSPTPGRVMAPETGEIKLDIRGRLSFSSRQIALYERCPRRFFYSHVLHVGGRRTMTAFMQMHEAVRTVVEAIIANGQIPADSELERELIAAFAAHGLAGHGYVDDFKALALAMLRYFISVRMGVMSETLPALRIAAGDDEIVVYADDVLVRPDGVRVFRRIQTGHFRSADTTDVGAAAFLLATQQVSPGAAVELVHLSDQTSRPLNLSPKELEKRRGKLVEFLQQIRKGYFPADSSPRSCPGCPAFFVCGPTPDGVLPREF
ncbi:ImmA/IrrE family metallo-endopeptidase [Corallococcus sp. AB030]|uniref:UvrD-helicase domain-containing protein n=1 Tax=Corallococcus sp. AB030 TaxID=2316716 RepID=UPI000EE2122B|nr:UvrD-helicase domain-containing protein [Corallococcus sp. AB030]RKH97266.1 ImmA/IrrE family metallo-endopeptidase [Corallococcus sp. AB030]